MTDAGSFRSFILRIRGGNEDAARELVGRFEGVIRREARIRIEDNRLLRVFDSMDIAQSVLTSFFVRVSTGHFELESPEQLVKLLVRMTRNKLALQVRRHRAGRRDNRLTAPRRVDELDVASASPGPVQLAADHDLLDAFLGRLGEDERQIAALRAEGWEWSEIAERLGGTPQARRMQLSRAVHRVAKSLKMDRAPDA